MNKPLVSVVIPCYKVEKYLRRCVDSVRHQTLKDIEIILVDDKSPDNTPAICDELAVIDPRIKVIHKPVNEGLGMARNTGVENAEGEYIMFLDSDDTFDNKACETLYFEAKNNNAEISTGLFNKEVSPGLWKPDTDSQKVLSGDEVTRYALDMIACSPEIFTERLHPVSVCILCINRRFLTSTGLKFESEREIASEDTLFKIKLLKACKTLVVLNYPFYNYFLNGASLSNTFKISDFENLEVLYNRMSALFHSQDADAQNRVARFVLADARSHIFKMLRSNKSNQYSLLREMLQNPIWKRTASFPIESQPFSKRAFFSMCRNRFTSLLFIYAHLIISLKK